MYASPYRLLLYTNIFIVKRHLSQYNLVQSPHTITAIFCCDVNADKVHSRTMNHAIFPAPGYTTCHTFLPHVSIYCRTCDITCNHSITKPECATPLNAFNRYVIYKIPIDSYNFSKIIQWNFLLTD